MSPRVKSAKDQLFSASTVVTLLLAVVGGGGGAVLGKTTKSQDEAVLAYKVEQLEKKVEASKEADLVARTSLLEAAQKRTDERVNELVTKMDATLEKMNRILQRMPERR